MLCFLMCVGCAVLISDEFGVSILEVAQPWSLKTPPIGAGNWFDQPRIGSLALLASPFTIVAAMLVFSNGVKLDSEFECFCKIKFTMKL